VRALIALLFALPFAACAPLTVPQDIPVGLTELPQRPLPPAEPTDRDVALLLVGQDEVIQACYSQMGRIRALLEPGGAAR
jgi:hypothetical protein